MWRWRKRMFKVKWMGFSPAAAAVAAAAVDAVVAGAGGAAGAGQIASTVVLG